MLKLRDTFVDTMRRFIIVERWGPKRESLIVDVTRHKFDSNSNGSVSTHLAQLGNFLRKHARKKFDVLIVTRGSATTGPDAIADRTATFDYTRSRVVKIDECELRR